MSDESLYKAVLWNPIPLEISNLIPIPHPEEKTIFDDQFNGEKRSCSTCKKGFDMYTGYRAEYLIRGVLHTQYMCPKCENKYKGKLCYVRVY